MIPTIRVSPCPNDIQNARGVSRLREHFHAMPRLIFICIMAYNRSGFEPCGRETACRIISTIGSVLSGTIDSSRGKKNIAPAAEDAE
jgi:hypothetical protein